MKRIDFQAISVSMEAYRMKMDLLTNATVVERAIQFVDRNSGLIRENNELDTDNKDDASGTYPKYLTSKPTRLYRS